MMNKHFDILPHPNRKNKYGITPLLRAADKHNTDLTGCGPLLVPIRT